MKRYCREHDLPVDRTLRCPECYQADTEYDRQQADVEMLWNQR